MLGIIRSVVNFSVTSRMSFSLDKPGFLTSAEVTQDASRDSPTPPLSAGFSSSASVPNATGG